MNIVNTASKTAKNNAVEATRDQVASKIANKFTLLKNKKYSCGNKKLAVIYLRPSDRQRVTDG